MSERRNRYFSVKTDGILNWLCHVIANTNEEESHRRTTFREIPMKCQR